MPRLDRVQSFAESSADLHQEPVTLHERTERVSPWMTTAEAAAHLRYTGKSKLRSLYRFLNTHGIPRRRRGARSLLIARADLDRALKGKG